MDTRDNVNTANAASTGSAEDTQADSSVKDRDPRKVSDASTKAPDTRAKAGENGDADDRGRPSAGAAPAAESLVEPDRAHDYRTRWTSIQAVFVDQPKDAVRKADALVEEVVRDLTDAFGRERSDLEQQWSSGEQVSTEQLRVALQRYRTFFEQLLSA